MRLQKTALRRLNGLSPQGAKDISARLVPTTRPGEDRAALDRRNRSNWMRSAWKHVLPFSGDKTAADMGRPDRGLEYSKMTELTCRRHRCRARCRLLGQVLEDMNDDLRENSPRPSMTRRRAEFVFHMTDLRPAT